MTLFSSRRRLVVAAVGLGLCAVTSVGAHDVVSPQAPSTGTVDAAWGWGGDVTGDPTPVTPVDGSTVTPAAVPSAPAAVAGA